MTDKQIIDGVDVSGCEFCLISLGIICKLKNGKTDKCNCPDYPNCYYKQLQRKEQRIVELNKTIKAKEQECEELKKKLKPKLKNAHCAYFDGQTGWCNAKEFTRCNPIGCKLYTIDELSTIVDLQQQLDQLKAENEKLKQTLTEIKEIARQEVDSKEFMVIQYMLNGSVDNKNKILEQILQKISESEVESD